MSLCYVNIYHKNFLLGGLLKVIVLYFSNLVQERLFQLRFRMVDGFRIHSEDGKLRRLNISKYFKRLYTEFHPQNFMFFYIIINGMSSTTVLFDIRKILHIC